MNILPLKKQLHPKFIFPLVACLLVVVPYFNPTLEKMSAGLAVLSGIILSIIYENPYKAWTQKITPKLLMYSVIGLGFGMNLITVAKVGATGIGYTFFSIAFTAGLGLILGKFLKNSRDISVLVTFGTAICGGSAIAAIAPTIRAKENEVSVALGIVFMLNAVSLLVFPTVGHWCHLSQHEFGLWSALAIHDTSSVVGATLQYGKEALEIGTTIKLARALWIIPVTFLISFYYSRHAFQKTQLTADSPLVKIKKPWFILWFLLAAALVTFAPVLQPIGNVLHSLAEKLLVLTLFCIGTNMSRSALRSIGIKPFIQGFSLWIITACTMLFMVAKNFF